MLQGGKTPAPNQPTIDVYERPLTPSNHLSANQCLAIWRSIPDPVGTSVRESDEGDAGTSVCIFYAGNSLKLGTKVMIMMMGCSDNIVALHIFRELHRLQNYSNGGTTTSH